MSFSRDVRIRRGDIVARLVVWIWAGVTASAIAQAPGVRREVAAFPTGDPSTSIILVEHVIPAAPLVNRDFDYELFVRNTSRVDLRGVELSLRIPRQLEIRGFDTPPLRQSDTGAVWELSALPAGSATRIVMRAVPRALTELVCCATVAFRVESCAPIRPVQPELRLALQVPPEAILCDRIPATYTVTNPGTGVAMNTLIFDRLPEGLVTADGFREVRLSAGDLAPGQTKQATVELRAERVGVFERAVRATADPGLTAAAAAGTRVVRPALVVTQRGGDVRYVGRPAVFEITVRNEGDAVARDTVLVSTLPAGATPVSATEQGQIGAGAVTWNFGTLPSGAARTVSVTVRTDTIGEFRNVATARAYCAEAAAEAPLAVRGIPAILLEVIDLDDPIEVAANNTYEITVTNQGSADGTNIVITAELPPELEFISAEGPVPSTVAGQVVTFTPLPRLAPKAEARYRVLSRGIRAGDVRFRATLRSDQLSELVEETESTRVY